MIRNLLISTALLLAANLGVVAQPNVTTLTLDEVLEMARDYSPQAILAKHQFRAAYWEHRTYKAEFLPSISFMGNLPSYNRRLTYNEFEDKYKLINTNLLSGGVGINQNVPFTGGRFFVQSRLEKYDLLGDNKGSLYMSDPVQVGYTQPIFGFNQLKWKKKIEPLKYLEAKRNYIESMETISSEAIRYFFDLVLAQQNLKTALVNYANTDTLYQIAKGRYNIGTIAENELLQMELSFLNSGLSVNEAEIDLQLRKFRLKSFLGMNDEYDIELLVPATFPQAVLKYDMVLGLAKENNPRIIQYSRNLIEADRNVAQAKADRGFRIDLSASFGLTREASNLQEVYIDPLDQQAVRLGVNVPILDWGLGRGRVKMAESSREVVRTNIQQALVDFEQDVYLKVMQFNLQETQLQISAKADTIAQSRYNVTKERFLIGRIDVIELNIAQTERDNARTRYIAAMRNYWQFYYDMRRLTQFDFINRKPIQVEFEELIK